VGSKANWRAGEGPTLESCAKAFVKICGLIDKVFPRLKETRFAKAVDFYSLFTTIWELDQAGCILTNLKRNRQAEALLIRLSVGVDRVRQQQRKAKAQMPTNGFSLIT